MVTPAEPKKQPISDTLDKKTDSIAPKQPENSQYTPQITYAQVAIAERRGRYLKHGWHL